MRREAPAIEDKSAEPLMIAVPAEGRQAAEVPAEEAQRPSEALVGEPSAATQSAKRTQKAWPVRREMLKKYGMTPGCDGCTSIGRGAGFQQIQHSEACRDRIRGRVDQDAAAEEAAKKRQKKEDEKEEKSREET